jgi:hypothetical protein
MARGRIDCGKSKVEKTKVRSVADSSSQFAVESCALIGSSSRDNRLRDNRSSGSRAKTRCEANGKK